LLSFVGMRIHLHCNKCTQAITPGDSGLVYSSVVSHTDSGVYVVECPAGHVTTTVLHTPKHEVLFLIAANAILDGYLREAVLSFSGALERYFEFALRVIARARHIPADVLVSAWKHLSAQSERQFGAFVAAWMLVAPEAFVGVPLDVIQKHAAFRNKVVHKGSIPSMDECILFGKHVASVIQPVEKVLAGRFGDAHTDECFALSRSVSEASDVPITVLSVYSVLDAIIEKGSSFEKAIERLVAERKFLGETPPATDRIIVRTVKVIDV